MAEIDFQALSAELLFHAESLLSQWFPGGKLTGNEYECGSLEGGPGKSLKINIKTGLWCDFATGEKGGDLISVFAASQHISQIESAQELITQTGFSDQIVPRINPKPIIDKLIQPPANSPAPNMNHFKHGKPSASWIYLDPNGLPLYYIARYSNGSGKKTFVPYSWSESRKSYVQKSLPAPRPLYGLDRIKSRPNASIIVTEGEKAADACTAIIGKEKYIAISWPNGSNSFKKADWSPIYGRTVIIWPDADKAGIKCAHELAAYLLPHCPGIKIIHTDKSNGWDAADAINERWEWRDFGRWAKDIALPVAPKIIKPPKPVEPDEILPPLPEDPNHPTNVFQSLIINPPDDGSLEKREELLQLYEDLNIELKRGKSPPCNVDILLRFLDNYKPLQGIIWYDEFYCRFRTSWESGKLREWSDADDIRVLLYFQRRLGLEKLGIRIVEQAVMSYGRSNPKNEPKDWLRGLIWDGQERISGFFPDAYGADESVYTVQTGHNFWVSMVARVFKPGCQVDNMVVLEGSQGTLKSQSLKAIAGQWFSEASGNIHSKDFFMCLQGKLIVEVAELDAFNRSDITAIKRVVTCQEDRFRAAYGRHAADYPRQCVFVGTTNRDDWNRDDTGARRFWPIRCRKINLDYIRKYREQLFAEAVAKFNEGDSWWKMPESAKNEQEIRRQSHPWEELIRKWVEEKTCGNLPGYIFQTTVHDVLFGPIKMEPARANKSSEMTAATCLKLLGFKKNDGWLNGNKKKFWEITV